MPQVEKLKIFLASPGDVSTERNHVVKVVEEINRTVAPDKGVVLEVIRSENAYPGYGKDGQAIINEQIGKMSDYVLFIGIMWNRVGTPTKRDLSGTIEEFKRAKRTFNRIGQPEIWFYFRSMTEGLKTKAELEQQGKVKRFKNSYSKNGWGLFREYKNPSEFRNKLREHITLWLNKRKKQRLNKSSNSSKTSTKSSSKEKVSASKFKTCDDHKQLDISISSNLTPKRRSSTLKDNKITAKSNPKTSKSISTSGAWVLLHDYLFKTQLVEMSANKNLVLNIPILSAEQEVNLRKLQSISHSHNRREIIYVYQNDAFMVQVESVETKSIKGKTSYIVTLKPTPQSYSYNIVNYYGYTSEQIAELRIRFFLLNEIPKSADRAYQSTLNYITQGNEYSVKSKGHIITDVWKKWITEPQMFLINARLAAVGFLKINNIVEHILELKISLISKNVVSVNFRGQIQQFNSHKEMSVIQVKGKCVLDSSSESAL
ncbi:hypothetical protein [Nostoc sp. TCL26-01]|uniref:hypothetical protein n=1 Tax=Nostoc sp. TCL26-01 TaxID=2576904 RepID=UPI0015BD764D|nr:hypothetical protein [Nostoc sp. TCL26-01]QLE60034.1 hypothetical protein FD725_32015 [Nostoc sp. TCL26-01]